MYVINFVIVKITKEKIKMININNNKITMYQDVNFGFFEFFSSFFTLLRFFLNFITDFPDDFFDTIPVPIEFRFNLFRYI